MKITCGTDIIEIERIKRAIERLQDKFVNKIFTEKEIEYCEKHGNQKFEHYAARFAAKEAIFKAISNQVKNVNWTKIEIVNLENGKPVVNLTEAVENLENIEISISHCRSYACANAIAIYKD